MGDKLVPEYRGPPRSSGLVTQEREEPDHRTGLGVEASGVLRSHLAHPPASGSTDPASSIPSLEFPGKVAVLMS